MSLELITLDNVSEQMASFVIKDYLPLPKNAVTLLSAKGGIGKTRLSLIMADRFIKENNQKVALWLTEDYPGQVKHIFNEMIKHNLVSSESLKMIEIITSEPPQLAKRENGLFKANYEEITKIGEVLIKAKVYFVVFDPLLAFYGGNENDNSEARVFIQSFAEWAKNAQITTLIIHHANKDGASRGATAFHDGVRARYEIDFVKDDNDEIDMDMMKKGLRKVKLQKDNWGARTHLWKLSDGSDEIIYQLMPPMEEHKKEWVNPHKKEFNTQPEITTYEQSDDNEFLGSMF